MRERRRTARQRGREYGEQDEEEDRHLVICARVPHLVHRTAFCIIHRILGLLQLTEFLPSYSLDNT